MGKKKKQAILKCPKCREPYRKGAAYCGKCGGELPADLTLLKGILGSLFVLLAVNFGYLVYNAFNFQLALKCDGLEPYIPAFAAAIALLACVLAVLFFSLRRHQKQRGLYFNAVMVGFYLLTTYGVSVVLRMDVCALNAKLDDSPIMERVVTVEDKKTSGSGRRTGHKYYLIFKDEKGERFELYVEPRLFSSMESGEKLLIRTKKGYYGWPWIVDYSKI